MPQTAKYDIFMDGSCSFCRWTRERIEALRFRLAVAIPGLQRPGSGGAGPLSRALNSTVKCTCALRKERGCGDSKRGSPCFAVLPKLAWLGRIASLPPLRWLGPSVYGFIARHRYSLPGAPARCETDTCALPARRSK